MLAPGGKGYGQLIAMLCASSRENSKQCWANCSMGFKALGVWNRYKASATASAQRLHMLVA